MLLLSGWEASRGGPTDFSLGKRGQGRRTPGVTASDRAVQGRWLRGFSCLGPGGCQPGPPGPGSTSSPALLSPLLAHWGSWGRWAQASVHGFSDLPAEMTGRLCSSLPNRNPILFVFLSAKPFPNPSSGQYLLFFLQTACWCFTF